MAAPAVAGVDALIIDKNGGKMHPEQVKTACVSLPTIWANRTRMSFMAADTSILRPHFV